MQNKSCYTTTYLQSLTPPKLNERDMRDSARDVRIKSSAMISSGGARGVMVIVVGNEHDDTSSIPERDWLHFT